LNSEHPSALNIRTNVVFESLGYDEDGEREGGVGGGGGGGGGGLGCVCSGSSPLDAISRQASHHHRRTGRR